MKRIMGRYGRALAAGVEVSAFVPLPRAPRDPEIDLDERITRRLQAADLRADRKSSISQTRWSSCFDGKNYGSSADNEVPVNSSLLIECTHSTLIDLLVVGGRSRI